MTAKQYKSMCRTKVELYSKIFKYLAVIASILITYFIGVPSIYRELIITTIWMTSGDIFAYILECKYHIKHDMNHHR